MSDEEKIRDLLALYCQYLDDGKVVKWSGLFAERAVFVSSRGTFRSRKAIQAFFSGPKSPAGKAKHLCTNVAIRLNGETARCTADFAAFRVGDDGTLNVAAIGRYKDELVKEGRRWLFKRRDVIQKKK